MPAKVPPFIRLFNNYLESECGCWEWQGSLSGSGYGQIKCFGKMVSTHRLSYELCSGKINAELEVMHTCDNKVCINPSHLELGTRQQNMRDAHQRGLIDYKNRDYNPRRGLLSNQSIQVEVLGKKYESINIAEKDLGLGKGTVRFWIKTNPNKAKTIKRSEFRDA